MGSRPGGPSTRQWSVTVSRPDDHDRHIALTAVNRPADELAFPSPQGAVLRNRNARAAWFDDAARAADSLA